MPQTATGIVVHADVTPTEIDGLRAGGFRIGQLLHEPADSRARVAEREATIANHRADNQTFTARVRQDAAVAGSDLLRAGR
ncbi:MULTISPECIES: hypothetical protein [unclassified Micromonospora]|uniref:hypothetical protein n=1 Tax=unclassified Micromonospora TaxID=2617518 RepID=UPI003A84D82A